MSNPSRRPWWLDACRCRVGLISRTEATKRGVPHLTRPDYAAELDELNRFATWLLWFEQQPHSPRPAVWAKVPAYAWKIEKEFAAKHPHPNPGKPPKPQPEATSRWTSPPWQGLGFHFTWGFTSGQFQSADEILDRIVKARGDWVAIEDYPATANEQYVPALLDAARRRNRKGGIWERTDQVTVDHVRDMLNRFQPDFYLADVEVDWSRDENKTIPAMVAKEFPTLPRAVLIAGMPDASFCQPWIKAGFDCMTQAYSGPLKQPPVPGITGNMDRDAYWRGWPLNAAGNGLHTWPVLEVNSEGSASLRDQLGAVSAWGHNFSIYCTEIMTDDDWAVLGA